MSLASALKILIKFADQRYRNYIRKARQPAQKFQKEIEDLLEALTRCSTHVSLHVANRPV